MGTKLYRNWWLLLIKGICTIILGVILVLLPEKTIMVFSLVAGAMIGLSGLSLTIGAISHRRYNYEWTWWLLEGLVDLVIATLIILNPMEAVNIIVFMVALWILIMGIIQIITSINIQYYLPGNYIFTIAGIIAVIFGVIIIARPTAGIQDLSIIFGIFAIIYGISQVYISILLRKLIIEEIGEIESVYL